MTIQFITCKLPLLVASPVTMLKTISTITTTKITTGSVRFFCDKGAERSKSRGNCFAYLGLSKSPELNKAELQRAYHNLQRRVHPDQANIFSGDIQQKAEKKEGESVAVSSKSSSSSSLPTKAKKNRSRVVDVDDSVYANVSYETLRDPFLRCRYLMRLTRAEEAKGAPLLPTEEEALMSDDEHRNAEENQKIIGNSTGDLSLSMEFLTEIMEANELVFGTDVSNEKDVEQLRKLLFEMEKRYDDCYQNAKLFWEKKEFTHFYRNIMEWTYIRNVINHAKQRL